jgi:hypothetical protein
MSRIDEGSDDQRIREMQEAEYRDRTAREKRANQERVGKSFQEVMSDRSSKELAQKAQAMKGAKDEAPKQPQNAKQATQQKGKSPTAGSRPGDRLARQAAVSQAMQGTLSRVRKDLGESARIQETERTSELLAKSDDERERIGKDVEKERVKDAQIEEQQLQRPLDAKIDPDEDRSGQNRDRRQKDGQDGQKEQRAEGVQRTEGPPPAHHVRIPQELIEKIASSIHTLVGPDGKAELSIALKGTMLDGVTLRVSTKKGKVHCVFEGCDKQLSNLIESSRGELMRQLGKRGLDLEILRAK